MAPKTETHLKKMLLALAALGGFDWAMETLKVQRERVAAALNADKTEVGKMALGDFADVLSAPIPYETEASEPKPKRRRRRRRVAVAHATVRVVRRGPGRPKKALPGKPSNTPVAPMHNALKTVLAKGPKPIRLIANYLRRQGVIKDTSPETKRKVVEFINADKTFSCKTRGVFAIRSRAA